MAEAAVRQAADGERREQPITEVIGGRLDCGGEHGLGILHIAGSPHAGNLRVGPRDRDVGGT